MTMTRDKIAELKRIAQNAWPGPWAMNPEPFDNDGTPETVVSAMDGKAAICVTMDWGKNNPLMREANALHIAAFDPQTILSLLALAERALEPQVGKPVDCSDDFARYPQPQGSQKPLSPAMCALIESGQVEDGDADLVEPQGQALPELPPLPEPLEIIWPELHSHALGCGVEDRGLRDRYECAEYGWQEGVDRAAECVPEQIYDADQMHAYARAYASQLALPAGPVPEGWKLVPIEPTKEMLEATSWPNCAGTDYAHMVGAAPTPPAVAQPDNTAVWENGELGRSAEHAKRAPAEIERQIAEAVAQPVADEREMCEACHGIGSSEGNFDGADGGDCYVCDGIGKVSAAKNERTRFEAVHAGMDLERMSERDGGYYVHRIMQAKWEAWQARAALCQPAEEGGKS